MRVFKIRTTAWREEDFLIITDLLDDDIIAVIKPIVDAERNGGNCYYNKDLIDALKNKFPNNKVDFIKIDNLEL
jgi:hypothetical protein